MTGMGGGGCMGVGGGWGGGGVWGGGGGVLSQKPGAGKEGEEKLARALFEKIKKEVYQPARGVPNPGLP